MIDIHPLPANQIPARFYSGGRRIDRFRGVEPGEDFRPEDWIGSTTTLAGEASLGLSRLSDGRLLVDAIEQDPEGWLGQEHVSAFGTSTKMLVKLLDAGQRLPVHAHPDDDFARRILHREHGKAEAWYVLSPGVVHLGLRRDLSGSDLEAAVASQDVAGLLDQLHARDVGPGDTVFVPPGELHAIGADVLMLEIQQPEDLSILLEWDGYRLDGASDGHLGVGFDVALRAVTTSARLDRDIDAWIVRGPTAGAALAPAAAPFFRLDRMVVAGSVEIPAGFSVIVVETGEVRLLPADASPQALGRGGTAVIPFGVGAVTLAGSGTALICRPPAAPAR